MWRAMREVKRRCTSEKKRLIKKMKGAKHIGALSGDRYG